MDVGQPFSWRHVCLPPVLVYTASTPGAFLAGKIVNGLSLGLALTTGQTYISEITSLEVRGIALSGYTFCMVRLFKSISK